MQRLNSGFNKFKVDDSSHVKMLIIQKMWKKSLNHSNIIANIELYVFWYIIMSARCNLWIMILTYKSEWFNSNNWRDVKKIINSFQYKCGI
jgi:hypothetical protein